MPLLGASFGRQTACELENDAASKGIVSGAVRRRLLLGVSSSPAAGALTAAPPSPAVGSCHDDRLRSAAALSLSKHQVATTLATASHHGAPAAVAHRAGVAVLAPADFCNVGRIQQPASRDEPLPRSVRCDIAGTCCRLAVWAGKSRGELDTAGWPRERQGALAKLWRRPSWYFCSKRGTGL